jgi:hypothetical protein
MTTEKKAEAEEVGTVSGGAIQPNSEGIDLGFTNEDLRNLMMSPMKTMSTFSSHVHTDDCYAGHRHVQPYGTTDLTNVPVYVRRTDGTSGNLYNDSGTVIGHYNYGVTIHCGVCNRELYSFYLDNSQSVGYPSYIYHRVYTYVDTYPYKNTTTNVITYPWEYTDDWWLKKSTIASNNFYSFFNYTNINSKVTFPWTGLPVWDTNGNVSYLPYTGCTNVNAEAHINPDACQPMGKKTKVHFNAGYWISNEYYFMGDVEPMITVTCADCGKQIAGVSAHASGTSVVSPSNDDWYRTSVSSWFYGYDSNGVIKQFSNTATSSIWHNKTEAQCSEYRKINDMAISVNWAVQATYNMIPWGTGGENDTKTSWYTRTTPIDYPLQGITLERKADLNNPVAWAPYRGCPYCGTFGTNYTCGEVEDNTLDCNQVVTSIVPEAPIQNVYYGNPINTKAIATYLDGHTSSITCTTTFLTNTVKNNQIATISYTGMINKAKSIGTLSTTVTVNVIPGLSSISVIPSATTVYNGTVPTYKVEANYIDGTKKLITLGQYTMSGWSSGYGTKTVTFTYTDSGKTVTANVTIVVKPNLTNLLVSANITTFFYGEDTTFTFTAEYEDGSKKNVAANCIQNYDNKLIGTQTAAFSYSENGIAKTASVGVIVRDYPVSLNITLAQNRIYQGQNITLQSSVAKLASGKEEAVSPVISAFDNGTLGSRNIIFSYALNDRSVSITKAVEIQPDLYDIQLSNNDFTIYRGQSLDLSVMANFNVGGNVALDYGDYIIKDFDNNVYDRIGKTYTLTYTNRGVEISKPLTIKVLPNIDVMSMSVTDQTTEGIPIPFSVEIIYEDGQKKTLTEADTGDPESGLSVDNYDPDLVGYQDIQIKYSEGGKKLSQTARIRVRALIKISIPISALISIDPNVGKAYAPTLIIENQSKESVVVGINSVHKGYSDLIDVLPSKYSDWSKLGKHDSKYIAIGFDYASDNWMEKLQKNPLFISEAYMAEIGKINKETSSSLKFQIQHGNSFESNAAFQYVINWVIRLAEE